MKKKCFLIGLAVIFMTTLVACGNKGALKAPEPPPVAPAQAPR